jgi:hypothetical protein
MYIPPETELKQRLAQLESLNALCATIVGDPRRTQEIWLEERLKHQADLVDFLLLHRNEIEFTRRSVHIHREADK